MDGVGHFSVGEGGGELFLNGGQLLLWGGFKKHYRGKTVKSGLNQLISLSLFFFFFNYLKYCSKNISIVSG